MTHFDNSSSSLYISIRDITAYKLMITLAQKGTDYTVATLSHKKKHKLENAFSKFQKATYHLFPITWENEKGDRGFSGVTILQDPENADLE